MTHLSISVILFASALLNNRFSFFLGGWDRPIADIEAAVSQIKQSGADILISVGGGSPIDSAKVVAYHIHKQTGSWMPSIAIPTTLSVAETTQGAGYTNAEGSKVLVLDPEMAPKGRRLESFLHRVLSTNITLVVLYDADITLYTPTRLWLSSAVSEKQLP